MGLYLIVAKTPPTFEFSRYKVEDCKLKRLGF